MPNFHVFCSMFGLLFLHLFLYGCNIFMWRKARINYSFIFELGSKNELKYRDVFLICTASMTAIAGVMFVHLSLLAKGYSFRQVQVIPGLLLLVTNYQTIVTLHHVFFSSVSLYPKSVCFFPWLFFAGFLADTDLSLEHILQIEPLPAYISH